MALSSEGSQDGVHGQADQHKGARARDDQLPGRKRFGRDGVHRRADESNPMVDARLPSGERVNVIIPPLSLTGI